MIKKEKILKIEVFNQHNELLISSENFDFPKDFFRTTSDELLIIKGEGIPEIEINESVYLIIYYYTGERIRFNTKINLATELQINVYLGSDYIMLEDRRKFYKTKTDLPTIITHVITEDDKLGALTNPIEAVITDINLGGVFVSTQYPMNVSDIIKFKFCILGTLTEMSAVILRRQFKDDKIVGYGCKFIDVSSAQEERLARYIFNCQLVYREIIQQKMKAKRIDGR